ncbi:shikimate dehydrogenase family protein [Microbacterium dauci]|uniref:Shikimate dehydrogenase n=1 Tax=Microbacterium dauci TaxID=3048008 RepID=A0ABT6ZC73_9MICO|nr:shikimate dehydrogenase [Microbacterium sp. LX3-4]MDJ1113754.1 shikimate dehydrogenase [Microbacterium sp. LX3-4]
MASALEVWGDPIEHSLSPRLHAAAYQLLGWDWTYGRRRVDERSFAGELAGLEGDFRGLSLTMPLKGVAFAAAHTRDTRAEATGAVNTLVRDAAGWRGFNTDVGGIVAAFADAGIDRIDRARIVGAGATATSAVVALAELGADRIEVVARRPEAAAPLVALGAKLGVSVDASSIDQPDSAPMDVTIGTLPGGVVLAEPIAERLAEDGGGLMDVVYGHWPTSLSVAWTRVGLPVQDGTGMLLHQAVRQIRAFSTGDVIEPLPDEAAVVDVMRRALMGD